RRGGSWVGHGVELLSACRGGAWRNEALGAVGRLSAQDSCRRSAGITARGLPKGCSAARGPRPLSRTGGNRASGRLPPGVVGAIIGHRHAAIDARRLCTFYRRPPWPWTTPALPRRPPPPAACR